MPSDSIFPAESEFALVVVPQERLRQSAQRRCRQALTALKKLRVELATFEREDRPAFHQWLAQEFGVLLTAARELEDEIRAKQELLHEVEEEMLRWMCDPAVAYQRVVLRRADPMRAADEDQRRAAEAAERQARTASMTEEEQRAFFKDWLRENFGLNPEGMDGKTFQVHFGNFRVRLFGETPEDERRLFFPTSEPAPGLKKIYRVLVRRLHPDRLGDGGADASWLWHEVQLAYGARDADRLETLLAFTELETDDLSAQTSLYRLRSVRRELRQTLRALRQSLRLAQTDDAWRFYRRASDQTMRLRVEESLRASIERQRRTAEYLGQTIAQWSEPPTSVAPAAV